MTLFEKIIRREIPATIVYEDDLCLCFKDIKPEAPVHLLLVPKKPIPSLGQVEAQDAAALGHLMVKVREIAKEQGILETGFRVVANTGVDANQTVPHLHFHILGGRMMEWPPG